MAWSIGANVATGDVLTASRYNQDVIANLTEVAPLFAAFTSWTPTWTQGVSVSFASNDCKYVKVGRLVLAYFSITASSNGTAGSTVALGFGSGGTALPTARASTTIYGSYRFLDAGATNYVGTVVGASTTSLNFYKDGDGNPLGPTGSVQVTTNDIMTGFIVYEAAS